MHAVMTDRPQNSGGVGHTVKHVLAAARQRRATKSKRLLDLDRCGKLAALWIVASAAHLLVEEAAKIRDGRAALTGGGDETCRRLRRVLHAVRIFSIQLLLHACLVRLISAVNGAQGLGDFRLDFRPTHGHRLRKYRRRNRDGEKTSDGQKLSCDCCEFHDRVLHFLRWRAGMAQLLSNSNAVVVNGTVNSFHAVATVPRLVVAS